MQIPSITPPIITVPLAQDMIDKAVPNPQATQPLLRDAVKPTPKSEKSNNTREDNQESRSRHRHAPETTNSDPSESDAEHTINISV